eukprot:1148468-Pelagomonas_calceolata.AAC.7
MLSYKSLSASFKHTQRNKTATLIEGKCLSFNHCFTQLNSGWMMMMIHTHLFHMRKGQVSCCSMVYSGTLISRHRGVASHPSVLLHRFGALQEKKT